MDVLDSLCVNDLFSVCLGSGGHLERRRHGTYGERGNKDTYFVDTRIDSYYGDGQKWVGRVDESL